MSSERVFFPLRRFVVVLTISLALQTKKKKPNDTKTRCFLLTHAHLDHISSLVMTAGTIGGCAKRIYGSPQTLKDLESIFSDRVWPRLATYDETNPSFRLFYHA